jgi:hypothetical protein
MLSGSLMAEPMIRYEHILRAIGQGLESLSLEAFDLKVVGDTFSIQGTPTRKESEKPTIAPLNEFKKAFLSICHTSKKSAPSENPAESVSGSSRLLRLQFTQADIDKLEHDGKALRSDGSAAPYRIAGHKSYERWVGMSIIKRANYKKSLETVRQ